MADSRAATQTFEVGRRRIRLNFEGLKPHRPKLLPSLQVPKGPRSTPEWAVTVAPLLGAPPASDAVMDTHAFDGFVAQIANDGRRVATFLLDPSRRKKELDAALSIGLHLILRREGRLDFHAAAAAPNSAAGSVLIVGPTGSGKTSLTIALALSGWAFLSDDFVVAWSEGADLRVAGLRVPLFLTPEAANRLPDHLSKGQYITSMAKKRFQPEELFPGQHLTEGRIAAVVFPERVTANRSTMQPLRALECFQRILGHSPFLASDPSAKACLEVARRIADLPSFVLHASEDVLVPETAARVIGRALD